MRSNKIQEFKIGLINYIDLLFAFLHFIIIVFPLIIVQNNLILEIMGIIISGSLLFLFIFIFSLNNPSYISYGIVLLLCNFFFLIPSIILVPLLGIFLILEVIYIIILTWRNRTFSASKLYGDYQYKRRLGSLGLLPNPNLESNLREGKQAEEVENQYKAKFHVVLSFLLLLVLVIIFFLWFNPSIL